MRGGVRGRSSGDAREGLHKSSVRGEPVEP
jgi:hypothetical protein